MDDMMFENFFKMFLNNAFDINGAPRTEKREEIKCGNCGITFAQFRKIGRLGCTSCYQSFREQLLPVIKGVQGSEAHTGKIPSNVSSELLRKRQIDRLRQEINLAILNEEYEKAAVLRDQIRSMAGSEGGLKNV